LLFRECVEDRDDIRVIQGGSNTRFAKESLPRRRGHEPGFHCLERDETTQVQVPGLEDFAHRAFANPLNDFEMTNLLSNRYLDHEEALLQRARYSNSPKRAMSKAALAGKSRWLKAK